MTGLNRVRAFEGSLGPWQVGFQQLATFLDSFTDTDRHTGVQLGTRRRVERPLAEI
jgi:hypothetical protein